MLSTIEIGHYRLIEILGQGGMGVVYQAQHRETGQIVALKTVKGGKDIVVQNIRREIHTLARLRHPGIIRILDEGVVEGHPWYAMELLKGLTLRQCLCMQSQTIQETAPRAQSRNGTQTTSRQTAETSTSWWTNSLALKSDWSDARTSEIEGDGGSARVTGAGIASSMEIPDVCAIILKLCAPLAYLHGEGIVHRDLKPDNVFMVEGSEPVIIDFGLITQFSSPLNREVLYVDSVLAGTANYLSPEQIRSDVVDARADLYALGCIFYELLTGAPPFQAEDMNAIIHGHLLETPVPPSHVRSTIPPALDSLVMKLLAKDPRRRIGFADTLAGLLREQSADIGNYRSLPSPKPYLYRPPLAGQTRMQDRLANELQKLSTGSGSMILLEGESGTGKTRLLTEFGKQAISLGFRLLTGDHPERDNRPLEGLRKPLLQIIDVCRDAGREMCDTVIGHRGKVFLDFEPQMASLPGQEEFPVPAALPEHAAELRLFFFLAETLALLARKTPLVIIIDDVHQADTLTLAFLRFIARGNYLSTAPICFVMSLCTGKTSEPLSRLLSITDIIIETMPRLDPESSKEIISNMLAWDDLPEKLATFIATHCQGNPLFIAEYLRTAILDGVIQRNDMGSWIIPALAGDHASISAERVFPAPLTIHELVQRRLDSLSREEQQLLTEIAIFGVETERRLLYALGKRTEQECDELLTSLVNKNILEQIDFFTFRIVHDKIRHGSLARLEQHQLNTLHRKVATILQNDHELDPKQQAGRIGHHWEKAGNNELAMKFYLEGADLALKQYAFKEAEELYNSYLKLNLEPTPRSIKVKNDLGYHLLLDRGRADDARNLHQQAVMESRQINDRHSECWSLYYLGMASKLLALHDKALTHYSEALTIAEAIQDTTAIIDIYGSCAVLYLETGQTDKAIEAFEWTKTWAEKMEFRSRIVRNHINFCILLYHLGKTDQAAALFEQALSDMAHLDDPHLQGYLLGNYASFLHEQGKYEQAQMQYVKALTIARDVHDKRFEGWLLAALASLLLIENQHLQAMPLLAEALSIAQFTGNKETEAWTLLTIAEADLFLGDVEHGYALLEQALDIQRTIRDQRNEACTLIYLARVQRRAFGDYNQAHDLIERALKILNLIEYRMYYGVALCEQAHIKLAQGQTTENEFKHATSILTELGFGKNCELGNSLFLLDKALMCLAEKKPLFRGENLADFPAGIAAWLQKKSLFPVGS